MSEERAREIISALTYEQKRVLLDFIKQLEKSR